MLFQLSQFPLYLRRLIQSHDQKKEQVEPREPVQQIELTPRTNQSRRQNQLRWKNRFRKEPVQNERKLVPASIPTAPPKSASFADEEVEFGGRPAKQPRPSTPQGGFSSFALPPDHYPCRHLRLLPPLMMGQYDSDEAEESTANIAFSFFGRFQFQFQRWRWHGSLRTRVGTRYIPKFFEEMMERWMIRLMVTRILLLSQNLNCGMGSNRFCWIGRGDERERDVSDSFIGSAINSLAHNFNGL